MNTSLNGHTITGPTTMISKTPYELNIHKGTKIPLENKWKDQTYYIVDVSYSPCNPIFRAILYTGLSMNGYAQIWNPTSDLKHPNETYYLKAIKELNIKDQQP